MQVYKELIYNWLIEITGQELFSKSITVLIVGLSISVLAFLSFYLTRTIALSIIHRVSQRTKSIWDDILVKNKFFNACSHLIPASIFYFNANFAANYFPLSEGYLIKASKIYYLIAFIFIVNTLMKTLNEIYNESIASAKERPISGVLQFVKIIIYFVCGLVFISIIFNKPLTALLAGLGAVAAILLLVFKDTILGFVASIQIGMNDMVKIGDYIEMPSKLANGNVTEINLTTVKVQNSDKTITNIPIYSLISESFINWKGIEMAGLRRIRRSINIDMNSIRFCDDQLLERFQKIPNFNDLLIDFKSDATKISSSLADNNSEIFNTISMTNLGLFRKYLDYFLSSSPIVEKELGIVVRHLQPTERGIPLEITIYCKEVRLVEFEEIQSALFEHILAMVSAFELRIFQSLSGIEVQTGLQGTVNN